ncbi:hypothetical protein BDQ17DRAFT_1433250 [Cyathus striatus]|nr:hypothetical protein BDQ17DRAFT_1433250 [Cyathus striatus]
MKYILQHLATALLVGITLVQAAPSPQGPGANADGAAGADVQNGVAQIWQIIPLQKLVLG